MAALTKGRRWRLTSYEIAVDGTPYMDGDKYPSIAISVATTNDGKPPRATVENGEASFTITGAAGDRPHDVALHAFSRWLDGRGGEITEREQRLHGLIDACAALAIAHSMAVSRGGDTAATDAESTAAYAALLDALDIPHGFRGDHRFGRASELAVPRVERVKPGAPASVRAVDGRSVYVYALEDMRRGGESDDEIADAFGVSPEALRVAWAHVAEHAAEIDADLAAAPFRFVARPRVIGGR